MRIVKVVFAVFLLMGMLASCSQPPNNTTELPLTAEKLLEEHCYSEQIRQLLAKNEPYSLEFVSNGDGTCYVSKLYLNNLYASPFDIIIPEKSPAGDVVTGIDLGESITDPVDAIPKYITWERMEQIETQVDTLYPTDKWEIPEGKWWVNAYENYDISTISPEIREQCIERHPIVEYLRVSIWLDKMSNYSDSMRRIKMIGLTPRVATQYYLEFLQAAIVSGAPIEVLKETIPTYANCSEQIRYVHIPSSVNYVNAQSLNYLLFDFGVDDALPTKGIVLPALDLETINKIALALGSDHDFIVFSLATSAAGYEEISNFAVYSSNEPQDDTLAWRYVDGVPTLW